MRGKLIASYVALIVFMIGFMCIYSMWGMQHFYHENYEVSLEKQAVLLAQVVAGSADYEQVSKHYSEQLDLRLTIVDQQGIVRAESMTDGVQGLENHLQRPEIQTALSGVTGVDTRFSETLQKYYLYVAVPVDMADGTMVIRLAKPLNELQYTVDQITAVVLFGIGLCAVFTVVMSIVFTKKLVKPLNQLNDAVNEVAQGNYEKKIYLDTKGEIATLAESFNVMNKILAFNVNELNQQNVKMKSILNSMTEGVIAVDFTFRVMLTNPTAHDMFVLEDKKKVMGKNIYQLIRYEEFYDLIDRVIQMGNNQVCEMERTIGERPQILRVNATPICKPDEAVQLGILFVIEDITKIRGLEQMRTDFVSNVSHELKTPLTSIIGFVDTLKAGAIEDRETAMRFLDIIKIESDRLYRLIQDILALSSIESAKQDNDVALVHMADVADQVSNLLEPKAVQKQLVFKMNVQEHLPALLCNRDRITQMLINIVENAIKYTEQGSVITTLSQVGENFQIRVTDTGIGIPAEQCARIFERFYRVDRGRSRNMGGTGLGLSIVKHIVLLYNGTIQVNSEVGKGSEFVIILPYKQ